jgi:hypothetical protein
MMQRSTMLWTALMVCGAAFLIGRMAAGEHGMGNAYVRDMPQAVDAEHPEGRWKTVEQVDPAAFWQAEATDPAQTEIRWSLSNTAGIWVAAFFTLAVLSFLAGDNPAYKVAESMLVGVSAAYWMVVSFWEVLVPNLLGKLLPGVVRAWTIPGLDAESDPVYLVPLRLGILLLWRLAPKGAWIARWPMAFIIGVFCGLRLVTFIHADFLSQIRNSIVPLVVMSESGLDFWDSVRNVVLVIGVLSCLVYFFFSIEHRGLVGKTARLGTWFLMVTFGAAFGYTVMGRIALLAMRLEFIFDDWLWLIDPNRRRLVEEAAALLQSTGVLG